MQTQTNNVELLKETIKTVDWNLCCYFSVNNLKDDLVFVDDYIIMTLYNKNEHDRILFFHCVTNLLYCKIACIHHSIDSSSILYFK